MTLDQVHARRELIAFLQSIAKPGFDLARIADDSNLLDGGVLDSLAIVLVIQYLEETHKIDFSDARLDPAQLASVAQILDLIATHGHDSRDHPVSRESETSRQG